MPLTKVRSGGYDAVPSSALTSVPASSLTGTSLPSTIGLGTTLGGSQLDDITGIPSTAKQVVIGVTGLSPNANPDNASYFLQLGTSGGYQTSGYENHHWYIYGGGSEGDGAASNGISIGGWGNASSHEIICHCYNVTGNTWTYNMMAQVNGAYAGGMSAVGGVTLSGALDRVRWQFSAGNYSGGTMSLTYY